ncbi:MAG TPA: hypothetical protein VMI92_03855, partial [Steroidobacteraceae bacterium]|nr:hypothetical protein [Steroidobacteraceae bacterium]
MIVARTVIAGLASCLGLLSRPAAASDLCSTLDAFIKSVAPNESRTVSFHTSWGSGFKDDDDPSTSMAAKRCDHGGYGPAKPLCAFLMENG